MISKPKTLKTSFSRGLKEGYVALTFDDGPSKKYTPRVLDILMEREVKATFFLVGKKAKANPSIVRRIYREGHEIGNHTYSHSLNPVYRYKTVKKEIVLTEKIIKSLTGQKTYLFRPPGIFLNFNCKKVLYMADNMGYLPVMWSLSTADWTGSKNIIRHRIFNGSVKHGDIILMHDGAAKSLLRRREATISTLPRILDSFMDKDLFPTTVSELLRLSNIQPEIDSTFM